MTDEDVKKECERLFQAGGPKVYLHKPEARCEILPSGLSARRSAFFNDEGQQIWARMKVRGERRYEWRRVDT